MKIILFLILIFSAVNSYCQKVTYKDLIGHWLRINRPKEMGMYNLVFIDSTHYNMVDTTFPLPASQSSYGTFYANYELDTSTQYTTMETWYGTNPKSRQHHTDFYIIRKKDDSLFMQYVKPKNAKWYDNDSLYLKKYKRVKL